MADRRQQTRIAPPGRYYPSDFDMAENPVEEEYEEEGYASRLVNYASDVTESFGTHAYAPPHTSLLPSHGTGMGVRLDLVQGTPHEVLEGDVGPVMTEGRAPRGKSTRAKKTVNTGAKSRVSDARAQQEQRRQRDTLKEFARQSAARNGGPVNYTAAPVRQTAAPAQQWPSQPVWDSQAASLWAYPNKGARQAEQPQPAAAPQQATQPFGQPIAPATGAPAYSHVEMGEDGSICKFRVSVGKHGFSLKEMATASGMKKKNEIVVSIDKKVFARQLPATWDPASAKYKEVDLSKGILQSVLVTGYQNDHIKNLSLDSDGFIVSDSQVNSGGARAPHVAFKNHTATNLREEIYNGEKAVSNKQLLAAYGQTDANSLTVGLSYLIPLREGEEGDVAVSANHPVIKIIEKNPSHAEYDHVSKELREGKQRILLKQSTAYEILGTLNQEVLQKFNFTNFTNLKMVIRPSDGQPADSLKGTRYANLSRDEADKVLEQEGDAIWNLEFNAYFPRTRRTGDPDYLWENVPDALRYKPASTPLP